MKGLIEDGLEHLALVNRCDQRAKPNLRLEHISILVQAFVSLTEACKGFPGFITFEVTTSCPPLNQASWLDEVFREQV